MAVKIQIRNGTASEWTSANPILAVGELAIESDTKKFKIGDGLTAWNSLAYATQGETGPAGSAGPGLEFLWNNTSLGVRAEGETVYQYVNLIGPKGNEGIQGPQGNPGPQGKGLQFLWSGTQLGVRVEGDASYQYINLIGPKGDTGSPGATGRGITTISRTSGNGAAGTTDTYTITYSDSTTSTFTVYNGANGTSPTLVNIGTLINSATSKTTPANADMIGLMDSAASNILKKLSWANIKVALKTYFDTLYNKYTHPTGDGNLHVPATGTTNSGKVLTAGATAGSLSWTTPTGGSSVTVEDVLTSTSSVNALSAKQGKVLNDLVSTKSSKSTIQSKTLSAASWAGTAVPYSYSLTVTGVTTTSVQEIIPTITITEAQLTALIDATIQDGGQATNRITLKAWGKKPTIDIPVRVILRGDM